MVVEEQNPSRNVTVHSPSIPKGKRPVRKPVTEGREPSVGGTQGDFRGKGPG